MPAYINTYRYIYVYIYISHVFCKENRSLASRKVGAGKEKHFPLEKELVRLLITQNEGSEATKCVGALIQKILEQT